MGRSLQRLNTNTVEETAGSEQTTAVVTAYGARLTALLELSQAEDKRKFIGGWALIAAALGWVLALIIDGQSEPALPWSITFIATAGVVIARLYGRNPGDSLSIFKLGGRQPMRTAEGLAVSALSFSLAFGAILFIYSRTPHAVTDTRRQVVDIEFVSGADAIDRHDLLPGTKVAAVQKKVSSNAVVSARGRSFSAARAPQAQGSTEQTKVLAKAPKPSPPSPAKLLKNQEASAQTDEMFVQKPLAVTALGSAAPSSSLINQFPTGSKWVTKEVSLPKRHAAVSSAHAPAALEEVAPPELVELTDTQGESTAADTTSNGGHSTGGKGAPSPLSVYLKELHRRIKRAWTPPKGETRTAEILFRIKRNGQLASVRMIQRSGNEESDEAAIEAVASCSPFKPLPDVIPGDYLDLEYTFNYTVDKLSEAPGKETQ